MPTALQFTSVGLTFPDGTTALDNVDLDVGSGEFVTVVGPSGCGKSTLLRVAAGLEQPTKGSCSVDRTSLGFVFQDATLFPWRTVHQNVGLLAELHGLGDASARIGAAIDVVGLREHVDKYPRQLSGGMAMRTSLARSLVLEPDVFMFDEPFGALDELTRERLNDELVTLFVARRFATLFITHSIAEAVFLSTRVVVMSPRPGRIIAHHDVPFPYPRRHDLRYTAEFNELAAAVSNDLRAAQR
ncbi:MAG: ABC transporter ATP-binding protein [Ilumatobacteraceae bacterium]|nr:ABC transporter ATP-binding protein [Ilumatobacteraceae bacterium]